MRPDTLLIQLRSLEAQLTMLRARLKQVEVARRPLAALYGILAGVVETTEEDIEAAELKINAEPA